MPFLFPSPIKSFGDRVAEVVGGWGISSPHLREIWRAYSGLTAADRRKAFSRTLRAVVDTSGQAISAKNRLYLAAHIPSMVFWGDQDNIIPVEHAIEAQKSIPNSRLEVFAGAGHFLHAEHPDRFSESLIEFIETTKPASLGPSEYQKVLLSQLQQAG